MTAGERQPVLLVEDSRSLARAYELYLEKEPYDLTLAETGRQALEALDAHEFEAVLLDLRLPDMDGMEILERLHRQPSAPRVVVITAHGSINVAVEAMRLGAFDFLVKPFNNERLIGALRSALKAGRSQDIAPEGDAGEPESDERFYSFIGASGAMHTVYKTIRMAAPSKATVFVVGESGTGKELAAEAVHAASPRSKGPMVAINCAAIPKGLIESEIFGHVRGSFTGAVQDREGAAARAHGGTLFLDEICEMDLDLQTKLLRFVQTGAFERVGDNRSRSVDVRFVCATNKDPMEAVQQGRFREDLFYRLHVIPVQMPPLRERGDDIMLIATNFLAQYTKEEKKSFSGFSAEAAAALQAHRWPGNIRELQNVIRSITVLYDGDRVELDMLPPNINAGYGPGVGAAPSVTPSAQPEAAPAPPRPKTEADIRPLETVEREAIEDAIGICHGNIAKAASLLGVSPSTIYRKKQAWENG
ncbi:MAG: sigma-54-dependent transcriptional regulator [Minwuia sp.]|uniref:sigma-54-dependent transcriptional regulator n=1 Tax=Minwuia sp. TaxID=2493630 RepID=UPI003A88E794